MKPSFAVFKYPEEFYNIFSDSDNPHLISTADAQAKPQISYIFRYLREIGCNSILLEQEYVDHDYLDDFANYYVKCFTPYKRFCRRAHFFADDLSTLDLNKIFMGEDGAGLQRLHNAYRGFLILKPLPDAVIGRTVLITFDEEYGRRNFQAKRKYKANLFGQMFSIDSLAFQEQDTVLAACATTALWSALQKTSQIFHTQIPTPSEITLKATKFLQSSRPIPSHGLNVEQICQAISEVGLTAEVQQINKNTPINSLIYSYIQFGLPVIIGYRLRQGDDELRHAVAACGYRLEDSNLHKTEVTTPELHINMIGQRISKFYVHDDNLGPFSRLKCIGDKQKDELPIVFQREAPGMSNICIPEVVIIPIYHKIRLSFTKIKGVVREFDKYLCALGIRADENPISSLFEWDIRLVELTELKQIIRDDGTIEPIVKEEILFSNLYKYLWLSTARYQGESFFSLISDATDMERAFCVDRVIFYSAEVRKTLADIILIGDPALKAASSVDLPSNFLEFIRTNFLGH